jgi:hypothetical protein
MGSYNSVDNGENWNSKMTELKHNTEELFAALQSGKHERVAKVYFDNFEEAAKTLLRMMRKRKHAKHTDDTHSMGSSADVVSDVGGQRTPTTQVAPYTFRPDHRSELSRHRYDPLAANSGRPNRGATPTHHQPHRHPVTERGQSKMIHPWYRDNRPDWNHPSRNEPNHPVLPVHHRRIDKPW